jgi:hypothetical protein
MGTLSQCRKESDSLTVRKRFRTLSVRPRRKPENFASF